MKFCVLKNTSTLLLKDTAERVLETAVSAGFSEDEIELLTQEQYDARKSLEPVKPQLSSEDILTAKIELQTLNLLIDLEVI